MCTSRIPSSDHLLVRGQYVLQLLISVYVAFKTSCVYSIIMYHYIASIGVVSYLLRSVRLFYPGLLVRASTRRPA